jgi:hypothetical protein
MAGVPHHALDRYCRLLVEKGYAIALCDQVEDPATAQGLVRREVTRVLTPGTVLDEGMLSARHNNFLAAVVLAADHWGLAYADISTGEFLTTQASSLEQLTQELMRLQPSEILYPTSAPDLQGLLRPGEKRDHLPECLPAQFCYTLRSPAAFALAEAQQRLLATFRVRSLEGLGCQHLPLAARAAGGLLEYLEEDFYVQALAKSGLIPSGAPMNAIMQIKKHESAHVALLKTALGAAANPRPRSFDFGPAFDNYPTFLAYAQALEDTGVRAYKGKAGEIKEAGNPNDYLTVALQIHSVEARHAAHIRTMRRGAAAGGVMQAGWITNAEANGSPAAVYGPGTPATTFPSEGNTTQGGLNLISALGTSYTVAEVSEAFDEALDEATVRAIAGPFIRA